MFARSVFYPILCLTLVFASCSSGKNGSETIEPAKNAAEIIEAEPTHLGGCILKVPTAEAPADVYQESGILPTDEYKPFTKKLAVYGITLIGRDDITDEFMSKVAQTIKEIFPKNEVIDSVLQKEVLRNMYRYRTVIPLFKGEDHEFSPTDQADWDITTSRNSICDIIMEGVPGQVNEVVEHILHHVTDVGLHYTFPDEWGISTTSRLYQAMQEAIDKGYYNVQQYENEKENEEEWNRVLLQEYAYWIIYDSWNLREIHGPMEAEFSITNSADLKAKLPRSYELFIQTIPKVMAPPTSSMLNKFIQE